LLVTVGFSQRREAGDVRKEKGGGGIAQSAGPLLDDLEAEHHSALVVLGDMAVRHP
jgi:hypothetical protein